MGVQKVTLGLKAQSAPAVNKKRVNKKVIQYGALFAYRAPSRVIAVRSY
jgi:hypothetical protein